VSQRFSSAGEIGSHYRVGKVAAMYIGGGILVVILIVLVVILLMRR
jgi:hypothetical protein